MKIAIDLRPLQIGHEFRGIGAYLSNVLRHFPLETSEQIFIFVRYPDSNPIKDLGLTVKNYEEIILERPSAAQGYRKLFALLKKHLFPQFSFLREYQPDVYFQPDFLLGLPRDRRIKKYVVMYDLIPLVLRNIYLQSWKQLLTQPGLGKRRRIRFVGGAWLRERGYKAGLRTVRRADRIFSISQATTHDLHALLHIPKSKIETIPLAPSVEEAEKGQFQNPKFLKKISNPYLLYIGGTDQRRRLSDLVYAFNLLNGRGYKLDLVFAGRDFSGPIETMLIDNVETRQAIIESSYKKQIHLLGYISQSEKTWLLKNAFAFVYPTLYEGFGLPVLEAMAQGCPAITYSNSSLPEVTGKAAILLEETGIHPIVEAVIDLKDNPRSREGLAKAGKKQAATFSWERCAAATFKALLSSNSLTR